MDNSNDKQPTETTLTPTPQPETINSTPPLATIPEPETSQATQPLESDHLADIEMGEDSHPDASATTINETADPSSTGSAIDQALSNEEPVATQPVAKPAQNPADLSGVLQKPKKKKTGLIIAIIITLLALLGGGAAAYKILVIDNQPQNFVDRAISTTMTHNKPVRLVQKINPGKQDGASIGQSLLGETFFNPETKLAKHQFSIDNPFIGKSKFDLMVDLKKQNFYVKTNLDKRLLGSINANFSNPLRSSRPNPLAGMIEQIYNKINNQWFLINESIVKELMEGSGADVSTKSVEKSKDLIAKCQNSKDLSLLKFIEVKKELDKKDNYRSFEVKFSKHMLKDSIDKHPNNQCLQEVKKSLDKADFKEDSQGKTVITIDTRTMLISDVQMSDKNSTINIEVDYKTTDKVELPQDAKPLSELKSLIEDAQKSFMSSFGLESSADFDSKLNTPETSSKAPSMKSRGLRS